MNSEKQFNKFEERKDILKTPLLDGQKNIVYSMIDDINVAEDVINIIEHTIKSSNKDIKFDLIVDALSPLIQEKARQIVGKLYIYKRRPCKYNNNCKDEKCIYTHDKDHLENKTGNKKRKIDELIRKTNLENTKSKEVIFNKVDPRKHSEDDIRLYAAEFGTLASLKKLNETKWLLTFEDEATAKLIVESRNHVMGDENIKKYFNLLENLKKHELQSLIEKTESLLNKLDKNNISDEIKRNFIKIKQLIKEDTSVNQISKENTKTNVNVQSLYFNSF
ncbi:zinc finger C3H domain-containing protein [Vairimorpha necatrix]|uniref:Zinc finger C3H domain-containing protein n=1 Tax=Vairimorpha necatrix TaxID=6039 RepID=A0AAX4J8E0_9MICR